MPRPNEGPLYGQEEDERLLFITAAAGGEVPIEDLPPSIYDPTFLYIYTILYNI